jgi:hypothetical protein
VPTVLIGMTQAFWFIYMAICRLSGQIFKEAEKLVVDVRVPTQLHAGQHAAAPAVQPAAAMDNSPV